MNDIKDAPWVGLHREDYYKHERDFIGYCFNCDRPLYEGEEYYTDDHCLCCEDCYTEENEDA
jgi:hypothetical protein